MAALGGKVAARRRQWERWRLLRSRTPLALTPAVDDKAVLALCIHQLVVVGSDGVDVDLQASVSGQRLLPQQALRLAVQLLDELARQEPRLQDLHPPPHALLHQAQFEDLGLLLCPAGSRREVPSADKFKTGQRRVGQRRAFGMPLGSLHPEITYREAASPIRGPRLSAAGLWAAAIATARAGRSREGR